MIEVGRGVLPEVERIDLPIRSMIRLPVIVADGLTPEQISGTLVDHLNAAQISGAVVSQIVTGTSREVWSLVDKGPAKAAATSALHYVMTPRFARNEESQAVEPESGATWAIWETCWRSARLNCSAQTSASLPWNLPDVFWGSSWPALQSMIKPVMKVTRRLSLYGVSRTVWSLLMAMWSQS